MTKISPIKPSGVMELLPMSQVCFQKMLDTIRSWYERFGFFPVETPVMEYTDILLTKMGGETEKQIYYVQSAGSKQQGKEPELALKFDLTVPLARYVAEHERELTFPFRRYQMQRVYRGESAQKGRYREFYQCDIDVIARDNLAIDVDGEMPVIIYQIFKDLNVGPFTIYINNRKLFSGLFDHLEIKSQEMQALILREIDKADKRGIPSVLKALSSDSFGLSESDLEVIKNFISINGGALFVLEELNKLGITNNLFLQGYFELKTVSDIMLVSGVNEENFAINLSIARGLDYYTGTVYETFLNDHIGLGSVCSGGRYDNLASHYTKTKLPGVGISIGATRLFFALVSSGLVSTKDVNLVSVFIAEIDPLMRRTLIALASELRNAGINTEVHLHEFPIAKQLKYADKIGARFVIIFGTEEKSENVVQIKDLLTRSQEKVEIKSVVSWLKERLS